TLITHAQGLVMRVIVAAHEAEAVCFAAGGNSAPYISVLALAEGWRGKLAHLTPAHAQARPANAPAKPAKPPITEPPPAAHVATTSNQRTAKTDAPRDVRVAASALWHSTTSGP
ncbi:MAG: hypothetical protein H0X24_25735, partial [Ktedonobacterales bacterium]|nr:hypothetical protein [Ktedonobacterales bacterium]